MKSEEIRGVEPIDGEIISVDESLTDPPAVSPFKIASYFFALIRFCMRSGQSLSI